jgi:hypothetical protein
MFWLRFGISKSKRDCLNLRQRPNLVNLLKANRYIVNVTQCSGGSVNMGQYETSTGMKEIGGSLERHHHRGWNYKIDVFIGAKYSCKGFQTVYETSLRGEMIILDFTFLNQFFCVICKPK